VNNHRESLVRRALIPILLILFGLALVGLYAVLSGRADTAHEDGAAAQTAEALGDATPLPEATPLPIFPTATSGSPGDAAAADVTPVAQAAPTLTPDPRHCPLADCLSRVGASGRLADIAAASRAGLPFGNYFDWWLTGEPPTMTGQPAGVTPRYWQMVSISQSGPNVTWDQLGQVIAARPGSIWIVGNEPDVTWQDDTTAEAYAGIYHDVYTFIKEHDPSAQLAIAGVAQPSPLRLAYLQQVLDTYQDRYGQPLPVDMWTVHAFILREQEDSWGVGIPPGIDQEAGLLYEVSDHNDLAIFQNNLIAFRSWMAEHGYGDKPLAVTEYGILHPADYGFPPEVVVSFLIAASDFMATASGEDGYPADDHRLVQYWFWYSVYDDGYLPTGNLYDRQSGQLTAVGQAYRRYLVGGQ
jgi:hypothetical protein